MRTACVRVRAIAILAGLSLPFAGGGTLLASPAPSTLPGTAPAQTPAPGPAPATGAPAAAVPGTSLIGPGTSGPLVMSLQRRLRVRGIRVPVDGTYGPVTRAGVRTYQRRIGVRSTGLVDGDLLRSLGIKVRSVAGTSAVLPSPAANAAAVPIALSFQGVPYRWGGESPAGFDCSGLATYAYRQIGKTVPHYTYTIWGMFPKVPFDQLAPGDLVFFRGLGHMGIYIGEGKMVHAPQTGDVVKVSAIADRMDNYVGAVRP